MFFDPLHCPNCRTYLTGSGPDCRCPQCGIALGGELGRHLVRLLTSADRTVAQLRVEVAAAPAPPRYAPAPAPWTATQAPDRPGSEVSGPPTAPFNPAAVLLSVGALCLVVAAIVFLSMSWSSLTLGTKSVLLAGVTAALAGAAYWSSGKALRASGETLWAITLVDLALDLGAARWGGLLGADAVPLRLFCGLSALAVAGAAVLVGLRFRGLIVPEVVAGVAGSLAVLSMSTLAPLPTWVRLTGTVIVIGAGAVAARAAGWRVAAPVAAAAAGLPWLQLAATGLTEIAFGRFAPAVWHGRAPELPAAAVLALVAAGALRARPARLGAQLVGVGLIEIMLVCALDDRLPLAAAVAIALAVTALAAFVVRPGGDGTVVSNTMLAGLSALDIALLALAAGAGLVSSVGSGHRIWQGSAAAPLVGWTPGETWSFLVLIPAVVLAVALHRPGRLRPVTALALVVAVPVALTAHPNLSVAVLGWLAAAAATGLLARRPADLTPPVLALTAGLLSALPSDVVSGWAYATAGIGTVALGRRVAAARPVTELAALTALLVAVAAGVHTVAPSDGTPAVAGLLTVAAVAAIVAGLSPTRRWWLHLSFAATVTAVWIECAVHHVHAPEPYALPLGAVVLAVGARVAGGSWLRFGPGLLIMTAPTAVLALVEPVSWRALLIAGLATAMLLVGGHGRQQAPVLIGAVELGLLVLRELGPYALALPRWVGIAAVGAGLITVGVNWERERQHLRRARHRLAALR